MIEAIKEIGKYAVGDKNLDQNSFLDNIHISLVHEKENGKEKVPQSVVFLNFDTKDKKITVETEDVNCENANYDSGRAYLWCGNFEGNKPQINITSNNVDHIFSDTLPLIIDRSNGEFKETIEKVVNLFFDNNGSNKRYIKPETFEFFDKKVEEIKKGVNEIKTNLGNKTTKKDIDAQVKKLKKLWENGTGDKLKLDIKGNLESAAKQISEKCTELANEIEGKLKKKYVEKSKLVADLLESYGLKEKNVSIYTVKINNQLICQNEDYKQIVYNEKIGGLFNEKDEKYKNYLSKNGTCSVCGIQDKSTTSNTTNLGFKFYITDKIGFSFGLDEHFKKNLNLCKDCYQYLMVGERFIKDNLKTTIGNLNVYIIPHFIFEDKDINIEEFSEYVSDCSNSVAKLENLIKFEDNIKEDAKYKKYNFIINYLFYQKSKSEFKVLKLIKDVSPTRLDYIREKEEEMSNLVDGRYSRETKLKICLNSILESIPLKQVKTKTTPKGYQGVSRYLDILDAIFSNGKVEYTFLINQFTKTIRIIKFETPGYNIWTNENFINKILQLNFLLLFFKKLNILESINKMEKVSNAKIGNINDLIPEEILNYWKDMEIYSEDSCKKALFLLGYIIGEIGRKQEGKDIKNKPILNKINFLGMDVEKIKRLSNEIFEKLMQYKILQYNEKIFNIFKMLFEENVNKWKLSNQENVFYVLSGYAFSGYSYFKKYRDEIAKDISKKTKDLQQAEENGENVTDQKKLLEEANKLFNSGEKNSFKNTKNLLKNIKINNLNVK